MPEDKINQEKLTREQAGRRGGLATSKKHGSEFYAMIGQRGGKSVSQNRDHMSKIGQRGGAARSRRQQNR
jgi:uncharacterized protein